MNEKEFKISIGAVLKEARETRGFSQQQVADHLGVTKQAISMWERGVRMMNAKDLGDYCDYLGISIDAVFRRMK